MPRSHNHCPSLSLWMTWLSLGTLWRVFDFQRMGKCPKHFLSRQRTLGFFIVATLFVQVRCVPRANGIKVYFLTFNTLCNGLKMSLKAVKKTLFCLNWREIIQSWVVVSFVTDPCTVKFLSRLLNLYKNSSSINYAVFRLPHKHCLKLVSLCPVTPTRQAVKTPTTFLKSNSLMQTIIDNLIAHNGETMGFFAIFTEWTMLGR